MLNTRPFSVRYSVHTCSPGSPWGVDASFSGLSSSMKGPKIVSPRLNFTTLSSVSGLHLLDILRLVDVLGLGSGSVIAPVAVADDQAISLWVLEEVMSTM